MKIIELMEAKDYSKEIENTQAQLDQATSEIDANREGRPGKEWTSKKQAILDRDVAAFKLEQLQRLQKGLPLKGEPKQVLRSIFQGVQNVRGGRGDRSQRISQAQDTLKDRALGDIYDSLGKEGKKAKQAAESTWEKIKGENQSRYTGKADKFGGDQYGKGDEHKLDRSKHHAHKSRDYHKAISGADNFDDSGDKPKKNGNQPISFEVVSTEPHPKQPSMEVATFKIKDKFGNVGTFKGTKQDGLEVGKKYEGKGSINWDTGAAKGVSTSQRVGTGNRASQQAGDAHYRTQMRR